MDEKTSQIPTEPTDVALLLGRLAGERKAGDMVLIDISKISAFADYMLILSGRSTRQVQSLADHIVRSAKTDLHLRPLGSEGLEQGNWVLLDYGDVVVHIFLEEIREYYDLEGLWSEVPRYPWPQGAEIPSGWAA